MTQKTFFVSDTHFGYANILNFKQQDGTLVRPGFSSVEDMDETMISNWNSVVSPMDKVYHLGDVCFKQGVLHAVMPRLNGHKTLLLGNHDTLDVKVYRKYFKAVYSTRYMEEFLGKETRFILSHYPLHEFEFQFRKNSVNLHGHIHEKDVGDPRYINLSVERIGYKPISVEEVFEKWNLK